MTAWLAITVAAVDRRTSGAKPQPAPSDKWVLDRTRVTEDERALTQIVADEGRQRTMNSQAAWIGPPPEMAHIGVERFRAGHRQKNAAEDDESDGAAGINEGSARDGALKPAKCSNWRRYAEFRARR